MKMRRIILLFITLFLFPLFSFSEAGKALPHITEFDIVLSMFSFLAFWVSLIALLVSLVRKKGGAPSILLICAAIQVFGTANMLGTEKNGDQSILIGWLIFAIVELIIGMVIISKQTDGMKNNDPDKKPWDDNDIG